MHALISYEKRTAPISKDLFSDRDENRYQSSQDTKLRLGAGRRADPGALSPVLHKKEQTSSLQQPWNWQRLLIGQMFENSLMAHQWGNRNNLVFNKFKIQAFSHIFLGDKLLRM